MEQEKKNNNQSVYRTGAADRPQKRSTVLPAVLMGIILLLGFFRICGGLKMNVLRQFDEASEDDPIVFSSDTQDTSVRGESAFFPHLGFSGEPISSLWQAYSHLPGGIYITDVEISQKDLRQGDVLVTFQGQQVSDNQALDALLKSHRAGDPVQVEIYRSGQFLSLELTVGK